MSNWKCPKCGATYEGLFPEYYDGSDLTINCKECGHYQVEDYWDYVDCMFPEWINDDEDALEKPIFVIPKDASANFRRTMKELYLNIKMRKTVSRTNAEIAEDLFLNEDDVRKITDKMN